MIVKIINVVLKCDNNKQQITLTVNTGDGFHSQLVIIILSRNENELIFIGL